MFASGVVSFSILCARVCVFAIESIRLSLYNCLSHVVIIIRASPSWGDDALDRADKHKYILASGGADGIVKLWSAAKVDERWTCLHTLNHAALDNNTPKQEGEEESEPPQVYALQFINHWKGIADGEFQSNNFLMTSSDDFVHLWEILDDLNEDGSMKNDSITLVEVMSIRFTCLDDIGYGVSVTNVTRSGLDVDKKENEDSKIVEISDGHDHGGGFGGERNPHNIVYVFDAQYCPANGLLGVALSDGSLRLVNGRGVCVRPVTLPGNKSHLTSFGWDATGKRLATCVATGHLILWEIDMSMDGQDWIPSCKAVLEGGHVPGRPLYGAAYCGGDDSQDLVISWGVDGRLCLWDSHSDSNIHAPLSTLVAKSDYPIYAVDIDTHHSTGNGDSKRIARIGCGGGGGGDGVGFLGVPVYLFDVTRGHESSMKKRSADVDYTQEEKEPQKDAE